MRRPLNDTEKMVLRRGREFQRKHDCCWCATDIQRLEYPDEKRFRAVALGITPAIQRLVKLGLIERTIKGYPSYYLVAQQAQGQGGEG